jgi:DNA-binding beta-propeller fold protein YncE
MLTLFLYQTNPITLKDSPKSPSSPKTSTSQIIPLQILIILLASLLLTACAGPAGLLRPNGVAVAPDGSLFVMDRGNFRVAHLSVTGQLLDTFGQLGVEEADIYFGWDIELDANGNIYISNQTRAEEGAFRSSDGIKVFTADGRFVRHVGEQSYSFEDKTNSPYGLDIDNQGRIYVADFEADAVRVFTAQGELLARFAGESGSGAGQFNDPVDVAVDDERQLLYIVDAYNHQADQFSLSVTESGQLTATHRLSFGLYGREPGQFAYPQNVAVDDQTGRVYIGDMGNRRIQVFDSEGQVLRQLAAPGNWQVIGLDVAADGLVYAADTLNNAIWVFELDGRPRRIEVQP